MDLPIHEFESHSESSKLSQTYSIILKRINKSESNHDNQKINFDNY